MNRKIEVIDICKMTISNEIKVKKLKEFLLDCYNEMEAQDQNMRPEVRHNLAEAYQFAKNYLRTLKN